MWLAPPTLSPLGQTWEMVFHRHETEVRGHSSPNSHCVCVALFDISNCNCDVIGERERANLVVQLAPFNPTGEATYRNVLRSSKYASHEKDILHHALHWICSRAIAVPPSLPTRS